MKQAKSFSHRWFIYSTAGLFVLLSLSIIFAAMILLRRGFVVREGVVTGSSMEPILKGPRLALSCRNCNRSQVFAWDTCQGNRPFRCPNCDELDMAPEFDIRELASDDPRILPGEKVFYAPLRMIRAGRIRRGVLPESHPSGLRRGDIVVIQNSGNEMKEIKRLIGFPGEQVAIEDGDLIVNGARVKKTLQQTLHQAVLVDAWDRTKKDPSSNWRQNGVDFSGILQTPDDSHDAHSNCSYEQQHWIETG